MKTKQTEEISREYYDKIYYVKHLKRLEANDRFTKIKINRVFDLLKPEKNEKIMDLGCGVGTIMINLFAKHVNVFGLDYSQQSLAIAQKNYALHTKSNDFKGTCCDGRMICFPNNQFDGVAAVDFTEHLTDDFLIPTIDEVFRILKPEGRFVIYTPSITHIFEQLKKRNIILKEDKSHIGLRTMKQYCDIMNKAGFKIEKQYFRPTDIPLFNIFETFCMKIPYVGEFAKRRICIKAVKPQL